jgi:hypothetical protein
MADKRQKKAHKGLIEGYRRRRLAEGSQGYKGLEKMIRIILEANEL